MTDAFFGMRTRRIEAECISVWYRSKVIVFIHKIINSLRLYFTKIIITPKKKIKKYHFSLGEKAAELSCI